MIYYLNFKFLRIRMEFKVNNEFLILNFLRSKKVKQSHFVFACYYKKTLKSNFVFIHSS